MICTYQEQYQSKLEMECNCFFISDLCQKESLFVSPVVHIVTFSKPFITFLLHVNIYGKYFLGLRRYYRLVFDKQFGIRYDISIVVSLFYWNKIFHNKHRKYDD